MKYYLLALGTVVAVCVGCALDGQQVTHKGEYHAPPAQMLAQPGPMVGGPGPGVVGPMAPLGGMPGGMPGPFLGGGGGGMRQFAASTTQVRFLTPVGMNIGWQIPTGFAEHQMVVPAKYNFQQGFTYRLKLSNIEGREGLTLYPTLQVYPGDPNTDAYLSHNTIPLQLTAEDFDQVESSVFVTKVIYLPDAKYQELAIANVETLVSTRLDPGADPIAEADKRGTIMAVLRMGYIDLESPGVQQPGIPNARGNGAGDIDTISYEVDGNNGQLVPPMPVGTAGGGPNMIPGAMMVAGPNAAGGPPIAGVNIPAYGMPITGTPIGLPGPPHLPYGGKASLTQHVVRNRTDVNLPKAPDSMLIDVRHEPGLSLPPPVNYIEYTEKHPVYSPGELSYPAWSQPGAPR